MDWYVLHTKPKQESAVAERLRKAGIETYDPRLKRKKYVRKQYAETIEPLFPCYLFARFDPVTHLWMISYTRGVRKVLGGDEGPWAVPDGLISLMRSREEDGIVRRSDPSLKSGDEVQIEDGQFAGFSGIFERPMKGEERVVVLLKAIEYQARVVVERSSLIKAR